MKKILCFVVMWVAGCGVRDPAPPWSQKEMYEQATLRVSPPTLKEDTRAAKRHLLAWTSEVRGNERLDCALLLFHLSTTLVPRWMIMEVVRSARIENAWAPLYVIAHDVNGGVLDVPGYIVLSTAPTSDVLLGRSHCLRDRTRERHIMTSNWRAVTGESPPALAQ
jgi:hypothetical protein